MKILTRTALISLVTLTTLSLGAWATCSEDIDMGNHKITNVASPINEQDAAIKAYVDSSMEYPSSPRYTRYLEIVTDKKTGLMWQDNADVANYAKKKQWLTNEKYANCLEAIERDEELGRCEDTTGDTAATYCTTLELGGYTDWRLPTREELAGIVQNRVEIPPHLKTEYLDLHFIGTSHPDIDDVFKYTAYRENHSIYWSSSSTLRSKSSAYFQHFHRSWRRGPSISKDYYCYVRCVRDGQ